MAEQLFIPKTTNREQIYKAILPQIEALINNETDLIANLANVTAVLKEAFQFLWIGFYWLKNNELVLRPFQGPVACTRIKLDKGVCGHAYQVKKTVLVPDVDLFPGHIACSSESKSEIVIPVFDLKGDVVGVLDVDSKVISDFTEIDRQGLEAIVRVLEKRIFA